VTADIHAFFDHVRVESVVALFQRLGAPRQAAVLLGRVTTYNGSLPQGGRASPAISNLAVRDLDRSLHKLAGKSKYSRYADDLAFSGNEVDCPTQEQLEAVLLAHGFRLRPNSVKHQLRRSGQVVTGLSLAHNAPTLTRRKRRAIERALHFGALYGMTSHVASAHLERSPRRELLRLEGHINAVGGVDKRLQRRWLKLLTKVKL
jgi:RNA-directed DNA polymerase